MAVDEMILNVNFTKGAARRNLRGIAVEAAAGEPSIDGRRRRSPSSIDALRCAPPNIWKQGPDDSMDSP
jgi:hypothetical protein